MTSQVGIVLDLALLTLRVLENRVGILTGDGCGDGLSMLKLLEMLSSGFDGVGLGKIGRWCGKLAASWHASATSGRKLKVGLSLRDQVHLYPRMSPGYWNSAHH